MTAAQLMKLLGIAQPSPVQAITPNWVGISDIELLVKRDDLLHSVISGNKWRKLKYALLTAVQQNTQHIISFGGGFSNHLHALGYCCHQLNIEFTAIVRGDYSDNLSPMLQDLHQWKANIHYVDRQTYSKRSDLSYLQDLQQRYSTATIIPEGGSQQTALKGVGEIISELQQDFDYIVAPVGSGGTLAGLINQNANKHCQVLGIGVLKGVGYLESLVQQMLPNNQTTVSNWRINHDFHCGGYAKSPAHLTDFCQQFTQQTELPVEPVYSGKMFFALQALLKSKCFTKGSKVLALHTGGLQGAR